MRLLFWQKTLCAMREVVNLLVPKHTSSLLSFQTGRSRNREKIMTKEILISKAFIDHTCANGHALYYTWDRKEFDIGGNKIQRPLSSFMFWINLDLYQSGSCRKWLECDMGESISLVLIAERRKIGGFNILRLRANCTRRPNLKSDQFTKSL